ncbi:MAG TPA: helix-turn-helix transcriptional regulator [Burkholderiaceae bacterium]
MTESNSYRKKVTAEQREESARLKAIWATKWKGKRTQEELAEVLGVGQAAVSHFLNGHTAISRKAAPIFAEAFKCKVADFSPRLAAEMEAGGSALQPAREAEAAFDDSQVAADPGTITVGDAIAHLAATIRSMPETSRSRVGEELSLLASVPDSPTLIQRITRLLKPFDQPTPLAGVVATDERRESPGDLLERKLEEVPADRRSKMYALLEGMIDKVVYELRTQQATRAETMPVPEPNPEPASHP